MKSLFKGITVFLSVLLGSYSQIATAGPITLVNDSWTLLAVPGSPDQNTVGDIFGDALDVLNLSPSGSRNWVVYTFDEAIQRYSRAAASTVLEDGKGFWIIQTTGADVQIDMPEVSTADVVRVQDDCSSNAGCFAINLPTVANGNRWRINGTPFSWSVAAADMRVKAAGPVCMDGCTLEDSLGEGYTGSILYTYDAVAGHYQSVIGDDLIAPWSGFWLDTRTAAAGLSPQLLIPDTAATVQVQGVVTEPDGTPAAGVAVTLGDEILATTDALGRFAVDLASDARHVLQFDSADYASQVRVVELPASGGRVNIDVTMLKNMFVTTVNPASSFTVVGPFGATVTNFPPFSPEPPFSSSSFVDSNGDAFDGPVELSITVVDVQDPAQLQAFPGAFSGLPDDGSGAAPLVSQGTVEYSFRDPDGNLLQLSEDASALIQIPLFTDEMPDGTPIEVLDQIPLWSLNESTGVWEQDGMGTVHASQLSPTGLVLERAVTHFSWWNCDVSPVTGNIEVGVFGPFTGTVNVVGNTSANIGWRPSSVTTVTTIGSFTPELPVPANTEVCVYADVVLDIGVSGTTATECVTVAEDETKQVVFSFGTHIFDPTNTGLLLQVKDKQGGSSENGSFSLSGAIQTPVQPLTVKAITMETEVEFTATGLPAGLELVPGTDNTSVVIEGRPDNGGNFTAVITGVDSDNNQDSVTINYDISSVLPPPQLVPPQMFFEDINIFSDNSVDSQSFFLSAFNIGGSATTWTIDEILLVSDPNDPEFEVPMPLPELPTGITLNASTGLLTVGTPFGDDPGGVQFFVFDATILAILRAENIASDGTVQSDEAPVTISRGSQFLSDGDGPPAAAKR